MLIDDERELRRLGEMLYDIAAGRLTMRDPLYPLVARLMVSLRGESPGVEEIVDRLLSIADSWYGVFPLMAAARALIEGEPLPKPPCYADSHRRAPEGLQ